MHVPDFLVIGAMKSGTTTLCTDLAMHPNIFIPVVKEPHSLYKPEVVTPKGMQNYAALFRLAKPDQLCGEASTGYTKLPFGKEVPERALEVCGPQLKLVYIIRNPLERALSHHYHVFRSGSVSMDFEEAVASDKTIITCSLYGMQLKPWISAFSRPQIFLLRFEDYISNRSSVVRQVVQFLGLDSSQLPDLYLPPQNVGTTQPVLSPSLQNSKTFGRMFNLKRSQFYKRSIRPHLSASWLRHAKSMIFSESPPPRPPVLCKEVLTKYTEQFAADQELLMNEMTLSTPLWNLNETLERFLAEAHSK